MNKREEMISINKRVKQEKVKKAKKVTYFLSV